MSQLSMFDEPTPRHCQPIHLQPHTLSRTSDPSTSHAAAKEIVESGRGENQCDAILDLLRLRPATAKELVALAINYRARVSNLRQAGYRIECRECKDHASGRKTNVYYLVEG